MRHIKILTISCFIIVIIRVCNALNCSNPPNVIDVNQSGDSASAGEGGSFKTIQSAIESISKPNTQWIHIRIAAGIYT
ncbi:hypothetical protein HN51_061605, partial [Arachis hypogaea]